MGDLATARASPCRSYRRRGRSSSPTTSLTLPLRRSQGTSKLGGGLEPARDRDLGKNGDIVKSDLRGEWRRDAEETSSTSSANPQKCLCPVGEKTEHYQGEGQPSQHEHGNHNSQDSFNTYKDRGSREWHAAVREGRLDKQPTGVNKGGICDPTSAFLVYLRTIYTLP